MILKKKLIKNTFFNNDKLRNIIKGKSNVYNCYQFLMSVHTEWMYNCIYFNVAET